MKKIVVAISLLTISSIAFSADWIEIASNANILYEGRSGTREYAATRGGKEIIVAEGRVFDKKKKTYSFEKWYVSVEDCNAKFGILVTLKMNGEYLYENDFVEKGGTIASSVAQMLCFPEKEKAQKGI